MKQVIIALAVFISVTSIFGQGKSDSKSIAKQQEKPLMVERSELERRAVPAGSIQAKDALAKIETLKKSNAVGYINSPGYILLADETGVFDNTKEAYFILTRDLQAESYIVFEMSYSDGSSNIIGSYYFPYEISGGAGFQLMKGQISYFAPQGPFALRVYTIEPNEITFVESHSTTYGDEAGYFPKMLSVKTRDFGNNIRFTIDGAFQQGGEVKMYINWAPVQVQNLVVTSHTISFFTDPSQNWIPRGRFRMTLCQVNTCDSFVARR